MRAINNSIYTEECAIDEMAIAGYRLATTGRLEVTIRNEMDLLAVNAGIANANLTAGTHCPKIKSSDYTFSGCSQRRPDKELAIICNH